MADGRVLSFSGSDYSYADGPGHTNIVTSLASALDGKVYSAGFDDQVREISPDGASFMYVSHAALAFVVPS